MKNWYRLNIDVSNALKKDFNFDNLKKKHESNPVSLFFFPTSDELFNQEWLEYMKSIDLEVYTTLIFYRVSNYKHDQAHIDIDEIDNPERPYCIYGINWVLDPDDDSEMIWYDPINTPAAVDRMPQFSNLPNYHWPLEDVEAGENTRLTIGRQPTLVNIGVPHNVETFEKERWSISVRIKEKNQIKSWNDAVEYFQSFIKE